MRRFAPQLFAQLFCISLILISFSNSQGQAPFPITAQQQADNPLRLKVFDDNQPRNLLTANNNMTQSEIRSSLSDIKKLAERLRSNLGFPRIKSSESSEPTNQIELTRGLLQLDKAIMSFVGNPMFQQNRVFDIELASRAGNDLGDVLRLVDQIRNLTKED